MYVGRLMRCQGLGPKFWPITRLGCSPQVRGLRNGLPPIGCVSDCPLEGEPLPLDLFQHPQTPRRKRTKVRTMVSMASGAPSDTDKLSSGELRSVQEPSAALEKVSALLSRFESERAARLKAEESLRESLRKSNRSNRLSALKDVSTVNIPHLGAGSNTTPPSSTLARQLPALSVNASLDVCLQGFPRHDKEDEICRLVMSSLSSWGRTWPDKTLLEREDWHPLVRELLQSIKTASSQHSVPVLKTYYEKTVRDAGEKRFHDFAFTMPNEQRCVHANTCFLLEVKGTQRNKDEVTRKFLLQEGVAQAINYLATRQEACKDLLPCGVACVASGALGLTLVRVDFRDDTMPVILSSELPLTPLKKDGGRTGGIDGTAKNDEMAEVVVTDGVRALVRLLLCSNDVAPFGLKPVSFTPAPPFTYKSFLGAGGFATVSEVESAVEGATMACKWISDLDERVSLQYERQVLENLAVAMPGKPATPFVPRVCTAYGSRGVITDIEGSKEGLLLTPIGKPCHEVPHADMAKLAPNAFVNTWAALVAAHERGYAHCDVRPGNLIFVPGGASSEAGMENAVAMTAYLIDWGVAKRLGQRYNKNDMMGVRAFFSARQLNLLSQTGDDSTSWAPEPGDDLEAAILTFFSLVSNGAMEAPFVHYSFLLSPAGILKERNAWIAKKAETLRAAVNRLPPEASAAKDAASALIEAACIETSMEI